MSGPLLAAYCNQLSQYIEVRAVGSNKSATLRDGWGFHMHSEQISSNPEILNELADMGGDTSAGLALLKRPTTFSRTWEVM